MEANSPDALSLSLAFLLNCIWRLLLVLKSLMRWLFIADPLPKGTCDRYIGGIARGKTVLVTTGRQAKTLHTVRALKEVGATVIVSDYEEISASAVSLACDKFVLLPQLDSSQVQAWVERFGDILVENNVDVVIPVSTINEVLYICQAKHELSQRLPHVTWLCPDLQTALQLDDRAQFSLFCEKYGVPTPEHGVLTSRAAIAPVVKRYSEHVILKRIESSVNRSEEIVSLIETEGTPSSVKPSRTDPWQWQRFVDGDEYSVWYVCIGGKVTFAGCYRSAPDVVEFDNVPIPDDVDVPVRNLISKLNLTGQFAFDYIRERKTGDPYVIECNPRASSVLETVSTTPLWAEAFFGIDVMKRTIPSNVGFQFHGNCWPWTSRSEGYFMMKDPLPFFAAEFMWPAMAVAKKGVFGNGIKKVDVNICKVIVDGPSSGRNLECFRKEVKALQVSFATQAVRQVDTVLLDINAPGFDALRAEGEKNGRLIVPFAFQRHAEKETSETDEECSYLDSEAEIDELIANAPTGETRLILGEKLSRSLSSPYPMSYRMVTQGKTLRQSFEIPLRKLRVLHVMGSNTSDYYEGISSYYGFECIKSIGSGGRFDHVVAYIHRFGHWSVGVNSTLEQLKRHEPQLSPGQAITEIESLMIDVAIPHMFDYDGLTAYRGLMRVLDIPMVGCSAEALALSTNKARTKACAAMEGVRVPASQLLREGDLITMPLPVIIKPVEEDNSQGISMIQSEEDIPQALEEAFQFGDEVLCEQFIGLGRELRVAVVEIGDGKMEMLPIIEYFLSEESPIRRPEDKITTDKGGNPVALASGGRTCPANVDEDLKKKLFDSSVTAHKALGCTDYSIYDYRIDPSGDPYMLESCLYCSFAPKSVLVSMQASMGIHHAELFTRLCERAMSRKRDRTLNQKKGMK